MSEVGKQFEPDAGSLSRMLRAEALLTQPDERAAGKTTKNRPMETIGRFAPVLRSERVDYCSEAFQPSGIFISLWHCTQYSSDCW